MTRPSTIDQKKKQRKKEPINESLNNPVLPMLLAKAIDNKKVASQERPPNSYTVDEMLEVYRSQGIIIGETSLRKSLYRMEKEGQVQSRQIIIRKSDTSFRVRVYWDIQ